MNLLTVVLLLPLAGFAGALALPRSSPAASRNWAIGISVASKPVPRMMVSTGCSVPSAVTIAWGRTSRMGSVTNSTLGWHRAGK